MGQKKEEGYLRISKKLFSDNRFKVLSAEAKLLYGFLLDRRSLSESNGKKWVDPQGNVFVYFPIQEIMERIGCGSDKASKLLKQLVSAGLIQRVRQGLGKPDRIVVKTLSLPTEQPQSKSTVSIIVESEKNGPNKPEINKINLNNTEAALLDKDSARAEFRRQISYEILLQRNDKKVLDYIVEIVAEVRCSSRTTIKICGETRAIEEVRQRFFRLDDKRVQYVCERFEREKDVQSMRGLLLMHLYFAENEMEIYYNQRATKDMSSGCGTEKVGGWNDFSDYYSQ